MSEDVTQMARLSSIFEVDLRNLVEDHRLGDKESLIRKATLDLAEPAYDVGRA